MNPQSISVIGAGGWGSALAQLLSAHGLPVTVWAHEPAQVEEINTAHTNRQFLPGVNLHPAITATADMTAAARGDLIVVVPPSQFLKGVSEQLAAAGVKPGVPLVCCTKGLEHHTGRLMTQVLGALLVIVVARSNEDILMTIIVDIAAAKTAAEKISLILSFEN